MPNPSNVFTLQAAAIAISTGNARDVPLHGLRTCQAVLSGSGSCSATVLWEVSNDGVNFITLATTTFTSGAVPQSDGFVSNAPWPFIRSSVTAISGTSASVTTQMVITLG